MSICSAWNARSTTSPAAAKSLTNANSPLVAHIAGYGLRDRLLANLTSEPAARREHGLFTDRHWSRMVTAVPERENEVDATAQYVEKLILPSKDCSVTERVDAVEHKFWPAWDSIGDRIHEGFKSYLGLRHLKKELKDIVFGYGPLEDLLRLPNVSEIMVVDKQHIYIERSGNLQNSGRRFISDAVIEADHSADRRQRRPAHRPLAAAGGCPAFRRQPRERGDRAAGRQRADAHDSQIPRAEDDRGRPHHQGGDDPHGRRVSAGRRARPQEHSHLRRHRHRQNDAAQLPQRFHSR